MIHSRRQDFVMGPRKKNRGGANGPKFRAGTAIIFPDLFGQKGTVRPIVRGFA
jgi:phage tail protein X